MRTVKPDAGGSEDGETVLRAKEGQRHPQAGKSKRTDSPMQPSEGNTALPTL